MSTTSVHRALRATLAAMIATMLFTVLPGLTGIASAETVCPNAAFRNGASANLPDCRAYELVTPVYKNGAEDTFQELGSTGESALIMSRSVLLPHTTGDIDGAFSYYTLTRTANSWMPTSIAPPASEYEGFFHGASLLDGVLGGLSLDGRSSLWSTRQRSTPEPERRVDDLYLERTPGGPLVEVGPMAPPSWPPAKSEFSFGKQEIEESGTTFVTEYSSDLSHVLLTGKGNPYPGEIEIDKANEETKLAESLMAKDQWSSAETAEGDPRLYEYVGTGNTEPLPVGVGNDGKAISECGTQLSVRSQQSETKEDNSTSNYAVEANGDNSMTADGRVVFFIARSKGLSNAQPCHSVLKVNELYARVDNGEPGAHTVAISQPSEADCRLCDTSPVVQEPAYFQGASEDGSKVFFTTRQPLLGDDESNNIYEYDFNAPAGERVIKVSGGNSTLSKEPVADVDGVMAIPQDGSHVYFVAGGVLTLTPNSQGQDAIEGADNLYVFDTETRTTSFIGDLCSGEHEGEKEMSGSVKDQSCPTEIRGIDGVGGSGSSETDGDDSPLWGAIQKGVLIEGAKESIYGPNSVNITPDGRFLVFESYADLTSDDTSVGASQVFEYDAQTGTLIRVSIGDNGYNDDGNSDNPYLGALIRFPGFVTFGGDNENVEASKSPASTTGDESISVSDDGSYVFFQSADGLTPQALNGVILDHFHCEEDSFVACTAYPLYANNVYEFHDGHVYLISDGRDVNFVEGGGGTPSVELLGTDPSGDDVFFETNDALVPSDTDEGPDVYDARVDGGFPEPEARPQCSGDECQGQLSGAPVLLSPGSEFQAGGSNFKPSVSVSVASKPKVKPKSKTKKKLKRKRSKGKVKVSVRRREGRRK
jgi:hypothetical protein